MAWPIFMAPSASLCGHKTQITNNNRRRVGTRFARDLRLHTQAHQFNSPLHINISFASGSHEARKCVLNMRLKKSFRIVFSFLSSPYVRSYSYRKCLLFDSRELLLKLEFIYKDYTKFIYLCSKGTKILSGISLSIS